MDLRKLCRICLLDNAIIDITEHKANVWTTEEGAETKCYTILELILQMFGKHICLDLIEELPMICIECLDNCLENYRLFMKLKIANLQLRELYESKNYMQLDLDVGKDKVHQDDISPIDDNELFVVEMPEDMGNSDDEKPLQDVPDSGDSLIVSDFLPISQVEKDLEHPYSTVHTIDYAAVELNRNDLKDYIKANRLVYDTMEANGTSVYKCKYCHMAYTSSEYLKTHMRNSHVCKYCTTAFIKVKDLNAHIKNNHSNYSCVVCKKVLSSSSNLRAHIKHLHGIQLPAQVALLDYRPANLGLE